MARSSNKRRTTTAASTDGPSAAKQPRSDASAKRTAVRTHGTSDKREQLRLKMHLARTKRSIQELRERLETWDEVEEENKKKKANEPPPRFKKRTDPSTWKLKGAAKPAHEVYNFDVRYVDPYVQDHERAKSKAQRQVNLLETGHLASHELGTTYLGLLMQYAHLSEESHHHRDAQASYLECIQLDDGCVTNARESLMRLYTIRGRYAEAYELGIQKQNDTHEDTASMLTYSTALAACVLHASKQSIDKETLQSIMTNAIRSNIFLAYYIVHYETFSTVMECQDDLEDDEPQSLLEEAMEYANDNALMTLWKNTGADDALRTVLHTMSDVDWREPLERLVQATPSNSTVDRSMFAGMFRTAMEMVEEKGK